MLYSVLNIVYILDDFLYIFLFQRLISSKWTDYRPETIVNVDSAFEKSRDCAKNNRLNYSQRVRVSSFKQTIFLQPPSRCSSRRLYCRTAFAKTYTHTHTSHVRFTRDFSRTNVVFASVFSVLNVRRVRARDTHFARRKREAVTFILHFANDVYTSDGSDR